MRPMTTLLILLALASCGPEPDGVATVTGTVRYSSSLPAANSTVAISCPRISLATTVATDSTGRYNMSLQAPSGRISIPCSFGVPDLIAPLVRIDTMIGFAEGLHALQFINLTVP